MIKFDLKAWRQALGWSQRVAAARLHYTLKGYQELDRGRRFDNGEPCTPDARTIMACLYLTEHPDFEV